jgi:hypothetical protein
VSDLDRLLAQVEELKKLALRPDDSWMNSMSTEELQSLGKRVRRVADGLSGLQGQLAGTARGGAKAAPRSVPRAPAPRSAAGSLGSIVRKDTGATPAWTPPGGHPQSSPAGTMDLANPMGRGRVGGGARPPETPAAGRPAPSLPRTPGLPARAPASPPASGSGWTPPWQQKKPGDTPPRNRNRPSF